MSEETAENVERHPGWILSFLLIVPLLGCYIFEYEGLQRIYFDAAIGLLMLGWLGVFYRERALPAPVKPLAVPILLFVLVVTVQAFRSTTVPLAITGFMRYVGVSALAWSLAASPPMRAVLVSRLTKVVPVVSLAVSMAGHWQWFYFNPTPCLAPRVGYTVPSFFNDGNHGGNFAAMLFPLAFTNLLVVQSRWTKALNLLSVGLLMSYIVLSHSRAGLLAVIAATVVLLVLLIRKGLLRESRGSAIAGALAAGLGIALAFGIMAPEKALDSPDTSVAKEWASHAVSSHSADYRFLIWKSTLRMVVDNPFGVGLGNFRGSYHAYRDPEELGPGYPKVEPGYFFSMGNPHSLYLHIMSELGPIGLAIFLWIVGWVLIRYWRKAPDEESPFWAAGMASLLAAMAIGGLFNSLSYLIAHSVYAWVAIGFLGGRGASERAMPRTGALAASFAMLVMAGISVYAVYEHWQGAAGRYQEVRFLVKNDPESLEQCLQREPSNPMRRMRAAEYFFAEGQLDRAEQEYRMVLEWEPYQPLALFRLGEIYRLEKNWERAKDYYQKCRDRSPRWPYTGLGWSGWFLDQGKIGDAQREIDAVLAESPTWAEALVMKGLVSGNAADYPGALEFFKQAFRQDAAALNILRKRPEKWLSRPEFAPYH